MLSGSPSIFTSKDHHLLLLLLHGAMWRMLRVGRILICVYNTNKDSLLLLLLLGQDLIGPWFGSMLSVLSFERIPLNFHE